LTELRQQLQPGDTLVVLRLDRLFRSVVDGLPFFRDAEVRGIAIRSVTENLDTGSPMGRLMLTMVLAFATAERELIAERMASGKKRNAETGKFNGGPVPFGYPMASMTSSRTRRMPRSRASCSGATPRGASAFAS
jgi:site-specific DNA recombinase